MRLFRVTAENRGRIWSIKTIIKHNNYIEDLSKIKESQKNHILLSDNSVISLTYHFDSNGNIIKHNISYIPDILDKESFWSSRQSQDEHSYNEYFNNMISKYLRIDFDDLGYAEYHHSKVHMHIGLRDNDFRLPVYGIIYPNEFIYFILKYVYKDVDSSLSLIAEFDLNRRTSKLTGLEIEKIFTSIGIFHV